MLVANQPWGGRGERLGDHIIRLLAQENPRFEVFRACVAFAKASGVLRLAPALRAFMDQGGGVEIVVGVDEDHTSRQALELLTKYSNAVFVFHNPSATFHPKMYMFEIPDEQATVFIGSSNLTAGGLFTNYEINLGVELDLGMEAERQIYESLLAVFGSASDVTSGNAKRLDTALLEDLALTDRVSDETRPVTRRLPASRAVGVGPSLFPRTPILPAPSIPHDLAKLIPRAKPTGVPDAARIALADLQSWEVFVMVLGKRDTRQMRGYSRDVYIPLAARDINSTFWGWPGKFRVAKDRTVGKYLERRIDVLVRPVAGQFQVVEGVRLYYYDIKHEFRLNCSRLIEGANAGDLLVIQKSPAGVPSGKRTYEFEATVIPSTDRRYQSFARECKNQVPSSPKRWGYA
jgi:HKD family nuclease